MQIDHTLIAKLATIELVDESKPLKTGGSDTNQILEMSIDTGRKRIPFQISVPDQEARLCDIVPLAQSICNKLTEEILDSDKNNPIACKQGCFACCSYLVALSQPETYYLQELLSHMPTDYHKTVLQNCLESAKKILLKDAKKPEITENTDLDLISQWYSGLNLPCPFLSDGCCDIYEHRPLACREHLVRNSSQYCQGTHEVQPEVVILSVSILEALGQLAAEFEQSDIEAMILPLAFVCTDDYFERSGRTWPAIELVQRFIKIIEELTVGHFQTQTA